MHETKPGQEKHRQEDFVELQQHKFDSIDKLAVYLTVSGDEKSSEINFDS